MITAKLRAEVRRAYNYRCGYCGVHENQAGSELEIDHYQPRATGGGDESDNLVYCCPACNRSKSTYWSDDEQSRLLHPSRDDSGQHLSTAADGWLLALTERGALHLRRLRLNRPQLIAARLTQQQNYQAATELVTARQELTQANEYIDELEEKLQQAVDRLARQ